MEKKEDWNLDLQPRIYPKSGSCTSQWALARYCDLVEPKCIVCLFFFSWYLLLPYTFSWQPGKYLFLGNKNGK